MGARLLTAQLWRFPNPVNEVSARLVAGGVMVMALATVTLQQHWLLIPIAYGFMARVLTGPTLSPLGQLSTRVLTPLLPIAPKYVAGPPKRFAQACGAALSVTALVLAFGFGQTSIADMLMGVIVVFAGLESILAFCVGCKIFGILMTLHLVPEAVCEECNNLWTPPNLQAYTPAFQKTPAKE